MGDKDLESIISNIGQDEMVAAQKQAQIDRLKQLVKKQKNEMTEQQKIIDELKGRIENMYDLPADVEQLKIMIGELRAEINKKDSQLEMAVGDAAQHEAELMSLRTQFTPLNTQLQTYINQVGELRAKLVEMEGLLKIKDQSIQELQINLNSHQDNVQNMEEEFAKRVQNRLAQFMQTEDEYKSRIAKMETRLEEEFEQTKQTKQDSVIQANKLKDGINERDLTITNLESKLSTVEAELQRQKEHADEFRKEVVEAQQKINEMQISSTQGRAQIENELKENFFAEKAELAKEIADLKGQVMEHKLILQESVDNKENAQKEKQKYQDLYASLDVKYQNLKAQFNAKNDELAAVQEKSDQNIQILQNEMAHYKEFKESNENAIINLEGLMKLFEEEPLFKIFLLLKDVGSMKASFLKTSLGIPTMTTQKYIEKFKLVGLIEEDANERLHLRHPLKKAN